jgi:hypothetical protein
VGPRAGLDYMCNEVCLIKLNVIFSFNIPGNIFQIRKMIYLKSLIFMNENCVCVFRIRFAKPQIKLKINSA